MAGMGTGSASLTEVAVDGPLVALRRAVEALVVPPGGEALAELLRVRDLLEARVADAVAAFDGSGGWDVEGATSMTAWLADRGGMGRGRASAALGVARKLRALPATAAAWRSGELSSGRVEVIAANVSATTASCFADHEQALVPS